MYNLMTNKKNLYTTLFYFVPCLILLKIYKF